MRKKMISIFALLFPVVLLAGCATTMPMSPSEQKQIHTVYVNPKIPVPNKMYSTGNGPVYLMGAVGGIIAAVDSMTPQQDIGLLAKKHDIFIDQIVKNAFVQEVSKNLPFKVIDSPNADATLNISINTYGLAVDTGSGATLGSGLKPVLNVDANLTDRQHQTVWAGSSYIMPFNGAGLPEHTTQDIVKNPELLRTMWSAAAEQAASSMVKTM